MKRLAVLLAVLALAACRKQRRHAGAGEIPVDRSRPGIELVYSYDLARAGAAFVPIEDVMTILRQRLTRAGLDDATVTQDSRGIVVQLPGLAPADLARVRTIIGSTGGLEFALIDDANVYLEALLARTRTDPAAAQHAITVGDASRVSPSGEELRDLFVQAPDRAGLLGYLDTVGKTLPLPADRRLLLGQIDKTDDEPGHWRSYLVGPAALSNADLASAEVRFDAQTQRPEIGLELKPRSAAAFEQLTAANVERRLAIVLDGQVYSAPVIEDRIPGGHIRISLGALPADQLDHQANDLVNVLRSLPLTMPLVEVTR